MRSCARGEYAASRNLPKSRRAALSLRCRRPAFTSSTRCSTRSARTPPTRARCACRRNSSKRSINWPRRSSAMPSANGAAAASILCSAASSICCRSWPKAYPDWKDRDVLQDLWSLRVSLSENRSRLFRDMRSRRASRISCDPSGRNVSQGRAARDSWPHAQLAHQRRSAPAAKTAKAAPRRCATAP